MEETIEKIIAVLGDGATGKTTLIQSIGHGNFVNNTEMTIQGDNHILVLTSDHPFLKERKKELLFEKLQLFIFDFGGQKRFRKETKPQFLDALKKSDLVITCFQFGDLTSLEEGVPEWDRLVSETGKKIPKILVGLKADESTSKTIEMDLRLAQNLAESLNYLGVFQTSSKKDPKSLEILLNAILDALPGVLHKNNSTK